MIPQISASFLVVVRARDKGESVRAEREAVGLRIALPENCPWWLSLNVTLDFKYKYEEYLIELNLVFMIQIVLEFIPEWLGHTESPQQGLVQLHAWRRYRQDIVGRRLYCRRRRRRGWHLLFSEHRFIWVVTRFTDSLSRSHLMSTQIRVWLHSTRSVKSEGLNINITFTNFAIACLIVLYNLLRRFILSSMSWFTVALVYKFGV